MKPRVAMPIIVPGGGHDGSNIRFRVLDSLRGIAALIVVLNHYVQAVPEDVRLAAHPGDLLILSTWASPWPWLRFTPLRLIVSGESAVDLFFVLSGFVLALQVTRNRQPQIWPFLVKRFCRVYLPFAVVILIVATAYTLIPTAPSPSTSTWLNGLLPPRGYSLAAHLLMTGRAGDMILDPVVWTLVHEMRVAAFLPVIFLMIRKIGTAQTVTVCLLVSVVASFGMTESISGSFRATLHFLWMFAAGSALSFHRDRLTALMKASNCWLTAFLWVLALALLVVAFDRVWSDFLIGCGAVLLVALCLPKSQITGVLMFPAPLWLGRVSYSLYLIHLPILILTVESGFTSGASIVIFALTLVLAELTCRAVEIPAHNIGVSLSRTTRNT
jgi:peptidoglycan/LPS O-acetylase OafA/YrhL